MNTDTPQASPPHNYPTEDPHSEALLWEDLFNVGDLTGTDIFCQPTSPMFEDQEFLRVLEGISNGGKRERDFANESPLPKQPRNESNPAISREVYGSNLLSCISAELAVPAPPKLITKKKQSKSKGQISKIVIFGKYKQFPKIQQTKVLDRVTFDQYTVQKSKKTPINCNDDRIGYSNKCGEKYINSTLLCVVKPPIGILPLEYAEVTLTGPINTGVLSLENAGPLEFQIVWKTFVPIEGCRRKPSNQEYTLTITFCSTNGQCWRPQPYKFYDAGHDHKRANK